VWSFLRFRKVIELVSVDYLGVVSKEREWVGHICPSYVSACAPGMRLSHCVTACRGTVDQSRYIFPSPRGLLDPHFRKFSHSSRRLWQCQLVGQLRSRFPDSNFFLFELFFFFGGKCIESFLKGFLNQREQQRSSRAACYSSTYFRVGRHLERWCNQAAWRFYNFYFFFLLFYRLPQCVYGEIDRRVGERFRLTVFWNWSVFFSLLFACFLSSRNQFQLGPHKTMKRQNDVTQSRHSRLNFCTRSFRVVWRAFFLFGENEFRPIGTPDFRTSLP